jgi:hypothetical protein
MTDAVIKLSHIALQPLEQVGCGRHSSGHADPHDLHYTLGHLGFPYPQSATCHHLSANDIIHF